MALQQLIAEGSQKLASVPSGGSGGGAASGGAAAAGGGAAEAAAEEPKEEEKEVCHGIAKDTGAVAD